MILSKSRYLSVCTDIVEMFPYTSGNFLSCTCWSIPQVSGQNPLPGRSERPAKIQNWAGFAELGNAFDVQRIENNFCECCCLNLETSLENAWVTSSQGYLLWIELMFIDILKELFCAWWGEKKSVSNHNLNMFFNLFNITDWNIFSVCLFFIFLF